jgi:mRNA interferase YafQ
VRSVETTRQFRRDFKKADRNPRHDIDKLELVVDLLQETGALPDEYRPHPLSGNWRPSWECHIQPDFLLIYEVADDTLTLRRCGSHSELFGR